MTTTHNADPNPQLSPPSHAEIIQIALARQSTIQAIIARVEGQGFALQSLVLTSAGVATFVASPPSEVLGSLITFLLLAALHLVFVVTFWQLNSRFLALGRNWRKLDDKLTKMLHTGTWTVQALSDARPDAKLLKVTNKDLRDCAFSATLLPFYLFALSVPVLVWLMKALIQ